MLTVLRGGIGQNPQYFSIHPDMSKRITRAEITQQLKVIQLTWSSAVQSKHGKFLDLVIGLMGELQPICE